MKRQYFFCALFLGILSLDMENVQAALANYLPTVEERKKLVDEGQAEWKQTGSGRYEFSFVRIEAFEGSKLATRSQQTYFQYCVASLGTDLSGQTTIEHLSVKYVILDFQGRLGSSGKAWNLKWKGGAPAGKKALPAKEFHQTMPPWAKKALYSVSGYLEKNPGQPVVSYRATDKEMLASLVTAILDFVPSGGKLKPYLGEVVTGVVETAAKKVSSQAIKDLAKSGELKSGLGYWMQSEKLLEHIDAYEKAGKGMWKF